MQVSKRREGSSSESVKFVSEHFDLFGLLLGDVQKLSLVSNFLDLLAWILVVVGHSVGLKTHDLLSLIHLVLKLSCLGLKLLRFKTLLADFSLELHLGLVYSLDSLFGVLFQLSDLVLKSLLVLFILLLVFALDDLLSLFSDSIELNILGSLLEVDDFKIKSFLYDADFSQFDLEPSNLLHQVNLDLSFLHDFCVLVVNDVSLDKNGIFIVRCNWKLRNFNLALLKVRNDLKVVSNLLESFQSLLPSRELLVEVLLDLAVLLIMEGDVLGHHLDLLVNLVSVNVHLNSGNPLLTKLFEVLHREVSNVVFFVVKLLLFIFFLNLLVDLVFFNSIEGVKLVDFLKHGVLLLLKLFRKSLLLAFAIFDEGNQWLGVCFREDLSNFLLLISEFLVVCESALKVAGKMLEGVDQEDLLLLLLVKLFDFLAIFILIKFSLLEIMQLNDKSDDEEFLLKNSHVEEELLLVEHQEFFLKSALDVENFLLVLSKLLLPGLLLLLLVLLLLLLKLFEPDFLFVSEFFRVLGHHPFLHLEVHLHGVLLLL